LLGGRAAILEAIQKITGQINGGNGGAGGSAIFANYANGKKPSADTDKKHATMVTVYR
jgi:hypothetical protein